MPPLARAALGAFLLLNGVLILVTYLTLLERKFAARLQSRVGPYEVGRPHGWLQPVADAVKLLLKEDIVPAAADRTIYNLAPLVFLVPAFLMYAAIPFAQGWVLADLHIGLVFVLAVSSFEVVGLFMCGWGSNNKYALLSAMRAVNQIISYEVPFILLALVPAVLAGSVLPDRGYDILRLATIVDAQRGVLGWFIWYPVLGQLTFLAFVVVALASENRIPFDIVEAESELVAGFRVEYSGMKFALVQLAEFVHLFGVACLGTLLFLGGWLGPGPAVLGPMWFVGKAIALFLLIIWVRWSFIRIRVDQILALSWKVFLPVSVILLLAAAAIVAAHGGPGA
jgi:NADH-quinone oxidoreductase subunit H